MLRYDSSQSVIDVITRLRRFGTAMEIDSGSTYTEIWYTQIGKTAYMNGAVFSYAYYPTPGGGTYLKTTVAILISQRLARQRPPHLSHFQPNCNHRPCVRALRRDLRYLRLNGAERGDVHRGYARCDRRDLRHSEPGIARVAAGAVALA